MFLDSAGLDLTPERPAPPKRGGAGRSRARAGRKEGLTLSTGPEEPRASGEREREPGEDREPSVLVLRESSYAASNGSAACNEHCSVTSSPEGLSLPHINSSAPLIRRIKDLKQQKGRPPAATTKQSGSQSHSPTLAPSTASPVLEHLSLPQPLKVGVSGTSGGRSPILCCIYTHTHTNRKSMFLAMSTATLSSSLSMCPKRVPRRRSLSQGGRKAGKMTQALRARQRWKSLPSWTCILPILSSFTCHHVI